MAKPLTLSVVAATALSAATLCVVASLVACSSSSNGNLGDGGLGYSGEPPPSRVYLNASMTAGAAGADVCGVAEPSFLVIGSPAKSVADGETQAGVLVKVSCSVTANTDGSFQVTAGVVSGDSSVTLMGRVTSTGTQTNVRGVFERSYFGHFEAADCTVRYDANPSMGVALGRVWGTLDCPDMADASQSRMGPDGGPIARSCHAVAEVKLEDCVQ